MCNIVFYLVRNQKIGYALVFEKAKNKSKTFGTPSFGILKTQTESNQRNDKFEHQSYHSTLHCTSLCKVHFKYHVGPIFSFRTALIRCGTDSRCWKHSSDTLVLTLM